MTKRSEAAPPPYRAGLAIAIVWIALALTPMLWSCGSSGGGGTNGALCDECGATDGPCVSPFFLVAGSDEERRLCEGVSGNPNECSIRLTCVRKLDSAQRLCFPIEEDRAFECDGERAGATPGPTTTPSPSATASPSGSSSPSPSGSSSATPSTSGSASVSPVPSVSPSALTVTFSVTQKPESDNDFDDFVATAGYPSAKGAISSCTTDDAENLTVNDDHAGTVTLSVSDELGVTDVDITCDFLAQAGVSVTDSEFSVTVNRAADFDAEVTALEPA